MKTVSKLIAALLIFSSSNAIAAESETMDAARCLGAFYISSHIGEKYKIEKFSFKYAYKVSGIVLNIKGNHEFKSDWNKASKDLIIKSQLNLWDNDFGFMSETHLVPCIIWFTKLDKLFSKEQSNQEIIKNIINSEKYSSITKFEVAQTLQESLINPFYTSEDAIKYSLYGYIEWISLGKPLPTE